jgi:hypothetical protein
MIRLKKKATGSYVFESLYYDDDGVHVNVKAPLTLTIRDGAGASIYTGTPTLHAGHVNSSIPVATLSKLDVYTFEYTASLDSQGSETVAWTDVVELAGGYIFEIADLRAFDRAFTDTVKFPTSKLRDVRIAVEDLIESDTAARVAFVPRGRRVTLSGNSPDLNRGYYPLMYGNDYRELIVPNYEVRSLYSGSLDGIAFTQDELDGIIPRDNTLFRSAGVTFPAWSFGVNNVKLHYVHGYERPSGAITRAALILAREYLVKSDLPARASATSIGDQLFRLTIAGRDGITGIPDVDAAISQFGRSSSLIG